MGTIISRKKRNAVITAPPQPVAVTTGYSASETASPPLGSQANIQQTTVVSHDDKSESDVEEKSEASEESDSETSHAENNDDENQSVHESERELSIRSTSDESDTRATSAKEKSLTKLELNGTSSDNNFTVAWKEALLDDLDIDVSDNVRIVRIFTSSTFTDTFVERNALMMRVYPRLKSYCQERGFDFQVVDMRWGVRDESTDDHMTTELCMRELRACQKLSTGPNFITFLGQKYGYRPFPAKITASEFEKLLGAIDNKDDLQLLKHWFWRDDNAVPAQYLLQPITSLLPNYRNYENNELRKKASGDWWAAFERMQVVLRIAADQVLNEEDRHKYHMSVTEDEIRRGIITVSTPEKHCFWFKRVITDLIKNAEDRNAGKFMDKSYGSEHSAIDESAQSLLTRLREIELPHALAKQNVLQYNVKWTSEGISPDVSDEHAKYLDKLCTDVYNVLSNMIQEAIVEKKTHDEKHPVNDEVLQHALFCQRKGLACQGRDNFLSSIRSSLSKNEQQRVIILHGESGCGKTSIMAKIAVDIRRWLEPESSIVVLRFIGTSPESSNIRLLLRSICQQLYMIIENDVAEIPEDLMELLEFFPKCLEEACNFRPVVVMLDSLDQLPAGDGGRRLDWLPRKLPDNCYFVLSTLPGSDYGFLPMLKELYPDSSFMEVPRIPENEADLILEHWLSSSQRTLTTAQKHVVLNAFKKCPLPLFLKLSFDEACRWKSYTTENETNLASSVKDIINDFLDQVERRHGKILVSQALAYVTASKNGLTEPELEDILSLDDEVLNDVYQYWTPPVRRLPPLLWIRIRSDLGDYLTERGADDSRVIYWYHRQFIEVATTRYLKAKKEVHSKLAEFFMGKWSEGAAKPFVDRNGKTVMKDRLVSRQPLMFDNERGVIMFNLRKLNELPYHLLQAGNLTGLKEATLCNFEFLLAKLRAINFEAVLDDFTASLLLYPEDEDLVTLEKTLQLSSFALKGDANQLAPQLLGRLMVGFDFDRLQGIHMLLQQTYSSSVPCLIPSDKCLTSPGGSLISSLKMPGESTTKCCGFSCDGKTAYIASSSSESLQVLIINLLNGKSIQRVIIPESKGVGLVWSIQGSNISPDLLLLAGSADIFLMKASTGQIIQKFPALAKESQYSPMPPVAFADNETRVVAITDETFKIWTVQDGRLVHRVDIGEISTDEEYGSMGTYGYLAAFCVHISRSFKVLNCRTGKVLREVKVFSEADECCIAEVKVTSKEQVAVTSSERNNLRLYDLLSGDLIREVPQFRINSGLLRLQITKDGAKAVGIYDYEILITNLEDGTVYRTLKSESFGTLIIHQKFYTRDGKFGISIAHDEVIRIYDLEQAVKENKKTVSTAVKNHKAVSSVDSITYLTRDSSDNRHVISTATVNNASEILIWDTYTGTKVRTLKMTQDLTTPSSIRMYQTDRAIGYIHDVDYLHFQVFDVKRGKIERRLQGKASKRTEAFGFIDESHVITFSRGRRNIKVWNINDGKLVNQYKFGQKFKFEDMLISRNGNAIVCSQVGQTVEHDENTVPLAFLNPKTGEQRILEDKGNQLLLWNGCISDDGHYLVCLTKNYSAQLWELKNGRMMHRLNADDENTHVVATAISTVSNVVLTGESDGDINVWEINSGHVQYTFHSDDADSLFITDDGRVAFSNYRSSNRNIDAWDLSKGLKLASFTSDWKPERMAICGGRLVVAKADKPELMSLRPHIPGYIEDVSSENGLFKDYPLESELPPCLEIATDEDEDDDEDDDFDQTDIQKTELTKKAVYASPNVIFGGGSSVFASKNIFISGNVTINGIPIQDL